MQSIKQPHREEKDCRDVAKLKELSNMSEDEFRQLCEKYDRLDLYEILKKSS